MAWFRTDAGPAVEAALIAAHGDDVQVTPVAIWIAGRMLDGEALDDDLKNRLERLISGKMIGDDRPERRAATKAAADLLHRTAVFDLGVGALADLQDQHTLALVAASLSMHDAKLLEQGRYFFWLDRCAALSPEYSGALEHLDFSLSRLIVTEGPHLQPVLRFLKAWVSKQPPAGPNDREFAELFSQCTSQLLNHPDLLSLWLTDWLFSDGTKLPSSVAGVLFSLTVRDTVNLRFAPVLLNTMSQADLRFLARRLLGYIHDADQLLSLALSLLDMQDPEKRVYPMMHSLLGDEIGYDFTGSTIEALAETSQNTDKADLKELLDSIRKDLESSMSNLEKLPRLSELKPPSALRRQFLVARQKQMSAAGKEAEKKSILRQIATTTYIKAGYTSFQYLRDEYTVPLQMKSLSHSIQLPRRENLDPVGNAIRGHHYRNAKRGNE